MASMEEITFMIGNFNSNNKLQLRVHLKTIANKLLHFVRTNSIFNSVCGAKFLQMKVDFPFEVTEEFTKYAQRFVILVEMLYAVSKNKFMRENKKEEEFLSRHIPKLTKIQEMQELIVFR